MAYQTIIKKIAGGIVLLVFSLSILPRNLLHDLISDHADSYYLVQQSELTSIEEKGFQCDQFQMVVDIPFLFAALSVCDYALALDMAIFKEQVNSVLLNFYNHSSLRGPPAVPGVM